MCPSLRVGPVIFSSVIRGVIPSCRVSRQPSMCCAGISRSGRRSATMISRPSAAPSSTSGSMPGEFLQRGGDVTTHAAFVASAASATTSSTPRARSTSSSSPPSVVARRLDQPQHARPLAIFHRRDRGLRAAADRPTVASRGLSTTSPLMQPLSLRTAASFRCEGSADRQRAQRHRRGAIPGFLATYPSIVRRVPQTMLASYLGITPETLSRIRKSLSRR